MPWPALVQRTQSADFKLQVLPCEWGICSCMSVFDCAVAGHWMGLSHPFLGGCSEVCLPSCRCRLGALSGSSAASRHAVRAAVHQSRTSCGICFPCLVNTLFILISTLAVLQTNDGVMDTAQQSGANYNCYPKGSALPNSCPSRPANQPQLDPVNNYMGYSESLKSHSASFGVHVSCRCTCQWSTPWRRMTAQWAQKLLL